MHLLPLRGETVAEDIRQDETTVMIYRPEPEDESLLVQALGEPSPYLIHGILLVILLFLVTALSWTALNTIDLIVEAPAVLIPKGKARLIQPPMAGIIHALWVREGDRVTTGQPLIELESETVSESLSELKTKEMQRDLARKELTQIVPQRIELLQQKKHDAKKAFALTQQIYRLSLDKMDEQIKRYRLEIDNTRSALQLTTKEYEINQRLNQLGLVADLKLLELQRSREDYQARIAAVESKALEVQKERDIAGRDFQDKQRQLEGTLRDLSEQMDNLQREAQKQYDIAVFYHQQSDELAQLSLRGVRPDILQQAAQGNGLTTNRTIITAPEAGTISQMQVRNRGEAVQFSQTLMSLIPDSAHLVAELRILNKDIGTIRAGQPVQLKFEAFPVEEYGAIPGTLASILPDAEPEPTGSSAYRAIVNLQQNYFRVKGNKVRLRPGLIATGEIVTEQKSILDLLLKPLTELRQTPNAKP